MEKKSQQLESSRTFSFFPLLLKQWSHQQSDYLPGQQDLFCWRSDTTNKRPKFKGVRQFSSRYFRRRNNRARRNVQWGNHQRQLTTAPLKRKEKKILDESWRKERPAKNSKVFKVVGQESKYKNRLPTSVREPFSWAANAPAPHTSIKSKPVPPLVQQRQQPRQIELETIGPLRKY